MAPANAEEFGRFEGEFKATFLPDGRNVRLDAPLRYIEPTGRSWDAPVGLISDGASIPSLLWSVTGGPFSGKYRSAAIVHDTYCDNRERPWQDVHRSFYLASRAAGVSEVQAQIMYFGVYRFGPRWPVSRSADTSRIVFRPRIVNSEFDAMRRKIEAGGFDLRSIEVEADRSLGPASRSLFR